MYLLDTNVISELRKNKPHGAVLAWLNTVDQNEVYLSVTTLGEIQAGIQMTRRQDPVKADEIEAWLDRLAEAYQVLSMHAREFREWARLMDSRSDDQLEDAMIAAIARIHDLTVVTRNTRDFEPFAVRLLNPFMFKTQ